MGSGGPADAIRALVGSTCTCLYVVFRSMPPEGRSISRLHLPRRSRSDVQAARFLARRHPSLRRLLRPRSGGSASTPSSAGGWWRVVSAGRPVHGTSASFPFRRQNSAKHYSSVLPGTPAVCGTAGRMRLSPGQVCWLDSALMLMSVPRPTQRLAQVWQPTGPTPRHQRQRFHPTTVVRPASEPFICCEPSAGPCLIPPSSRRVHGFSLFGPQRKTYMQCSSRRWSLPRHQAMLPRPRARRGRWRSAEYIVVLRSGSRAP